MRDLRDGDTFCRSIVKSRGRVGDDCLGAGRDCSRNKAVAVGRPTLHCDKKRASPDCAGVEFDETYRRVVTSPRDDGNARSAWENRNITCTFYSYCRMVEFPDATLRKW